MWDLSVSFVNASLKFFSGIDGAFKTLKEIGYDAVCPSESIPNGNKEEYISNLKSASKKYDLKINMLHLPMVCEVPRKVFLSEKFINETIEYIDLAEKIGCKYAVVHPLQPWKADFFKPEEKFDYSLIKQECKEVNFEFFKKIQPYAINSGVELAIENLFSFDPENRLHLPSCCSDVEEWIDYIDTLGKGFCACLDTGHANLADKDDDKLIQTVERLGDRLKTLHVQQNYAKFLGFGDYHQMPFMGDIDLIRFAKALKKIGYTGDFNHEVLFSCVDKRIFIEQLRYLKVATDVIYDLIK